MLKLAVRNLLSRPLRSLLALLGLTVAIAGMVGLFSVAEGVDELVDQTFGHIPGLSVVQTGSPVPLFSRIPAKWADDIRKIPGVRVVNPEILGRANVIEGKSITAPPRLLLGTNTKWRSQLSWDVYRDALTSGRFLTPDDRGTFNTVISRQIARQFNKTVGDVIRVNNYDLTIVGLYHCGSLMLDLVIVLDIDAARTVTRFDANTVCGFYVETEDAADKQQVAETIKKTFQGRDVRQTQPWNWWNRMPQSDSNPMASFFNSLDGALKSTDTAAVIEEQQSSRRPVQMAAEEFPIEVRSADDWTEELDQFTANLDISLTILTSLGVIIAVLNIVNTMLMSVSERMIEFGILKANGWSKRNVMTLISIESALLGIGGGVLGAGFGWIGTQAANWYWPDQAHLVATPNLLIFAFFFSVVLGTLGGLYPAIRAMLMMPMDAIRLG